jgi:SAM-dependent methyltransferase
MTSNAWEMAWKDAQSSSPLKVTSYNELDWNRYWDHVARQYLRDVLSDEWFYRGIVEHLMAELAFMPGDRVLDIGCGPGTFSLIFAENARNVDALDPSSGMLSTMEEEASNRGLYNITPIRSKWNQHSSKMKYDLVFSSLSPGINDSSTLLKMEEYSRRSCCYTTFGDSSGVVLRDELWERIVGDRPSGAYHYSYPYNILMENCRSPRLVFFEMHSSSMIPAGRLIECYQIYFSIFTSMDDEKRKIIKEYVEDHSRDGIYERETNQSMAVILWDKPEFPV